MSDPAIGAGQLEVVRLRKSFGDFLALDDVSLTVGPREFLCLLGPSGCGKTTLLRLIAGLLRPDSGQLRLDGQDLARTPARQRGFGIVFQSYSLFPSMTVAENVGYGLKIRGAAKPAIRARVAELLELVGLPAAGAKYPWQLSGGQQQRIALARAVAVSPRLLLLDEPLSALDAQVRQVLRQEILELQRRLGIPTVMVTHDQEEALSLADRIACMKDGRIAQIGTPAELYAQPANRFVAEFMGVSNLIDLPTLRAFAPALLARGQGVRDGALACIRPEAIRVSLGGEGRVLSSIFLGNVTRLRVAWAGQVVIVEVPGRAGIEPGSAVSLDFATADCAWVDAA